MADVFERRPELNSHRIRLWQLIERTPWLDWLLLTKRPQNVEKLIHWGRQWPLNVWLGVTIENQFFAEKRLPLLLRNPAAVRFISCEPLLGALDLSTWFRRVGFYPLDWVIAGGESGPTSRPTHPDWASRILRQCQEANIPFHFKQWGHWVPAELTKAGTSAQILTFDSARPAKMVAMTKKAAGRTLEGTTWDGVPTSKLVNV